VGIGGGDKSHVQHIRTLVVIHKQAVATYQSFIFLAPQSLSNPFVAAIAIHLDTVVDGRLQGSWGVLAQGFLYSGCRLLCSGLLCCFGWLCAPRKETAKECHYACQQTYAHRLQLCLCGNCFEVFPAYQGSLQAVDYLDDFTFGDAAQAAAGN